MIILQNLIYIIVRMFSYVYIALIQLWKPMQPNFAPTNAVMWNLAIDNKRKFKSRSCTAPPVRRWRDY